MTTRVTWTPKTNSQRTALRRFPEWELTPGFRPLRVRGSVCHFICPVNNPLEARWVPVEQVRFEENTQ
jgi:hypothetical protein